MIISHKYKFIFIRIPKTASTSIEIGLSNICGSSDIITPIKFKNDPENKVDDYRGPQNIKHDTLPFNLSDWMRIILRKQPVDYKHATANQIKKLVGIKIWDQYYKFCLVRNPFDRAISLYYWSTKNWDKKNDQPAPDINEYILQIPERKLSTWARYTIKNKIALDFIGRYEYLKDDIAQVERTIGIPPLVLAHAKSGTRKDRRHYTEIINNPAREYIETICASEISSFGYKWDTNIS